MKYKQYAFESVLMMAVGFALSYAFAREQNVLLTSYFGILALYGLGRFIATPIEN